MLKEDCLQGNKIKTRDANKPKEGSASIIMMVMALWQTLKWQETLSMKDHADIANHANIHMFATNKKHVILIIIIRSHRSN